MPWLLTARFLLLASALSLAPTLASAGDDPYPGYLLDENPEGVEQVEVEEMEHLYIDYDQPRPLYPVRTGSGGGAPFRESAARRLIEATQVAVPRDFEPSHMAGAGPTPGLEPEPEPGFALEPTPAPAVDLTATRAPAALSLPVAAQAFPLHRSETEKAVREYVNAFEQAEPSLFARVRNAHWRRLGGR